MFSKNLKYYRLKKNMTKKELAALIGVSSMAISYYESGQRNPDMDTIKKIASALGIRVSDFLSRRNETLAFVHGEFRKNSKLPIKQQEFIRESVEEYVGRFYSILDILGDKVLPEAPEAHQIEITGDYEKDALEMRRYLKISESGPVGNMIELLENKGIIVYVCNEECPDFSGMNGSVNGRPYIIVNGNMTTERIRSTIAHELAHFLFVWNETLEEKEVEKMATAISGAFLFPAEDAVRELGVRRTKVSRDMNYICKEYGISMYLLVKRANMCNIFSDGIAKDFYIEAGKRGWKKNEPTRILREEPLLFSQLVFRAVCENEISIQKGAELLKIPYDYVVNQCFAEGDSGWNI